MVIRARLAALLAIGFLSAAVIGMPAASVYAGGEMAFDSAPVGDAELAGSYGKFIAPNGVDIAMIVQSDTAINGQIVLRSVLIADRGPASIQVFAPAVGAQGPQVQGNAAQSATGSQGLTVTIDRTGATSTVRPTYAASPTMPNVAIGEGGQTDSSGLVPVTVSAGGAGVDTGAGTVTAATTANGSRITLDAQGLSISHLIGGATGSIITNTVNNRTIDTVTTVSIDVHNSEALSLGSSLLRVDGLATAATQAMVR